MDAVLLLNKPAGMTSFDAVSRCRRVLHEKKVGHTGTLDPNASGLMILLFGKYTKFLPYCVKDHKHYEAGFCFGKDTDTQDIWGTVTAEQEPKPHTVEEVQNAADKFLGEGTQVPPMYSAVKINGRKLYELARKGQTVERKPRPVMIDQMDIFRCESGWTLSATVSGGTYIRTLIHDLGQELGEYAVMTSLVRKGIESISLEEACTLEELESAPAFVPVERVLDPSIPRMEAPDYDSVIHGRTIRMDHDAPLVLFERQGQVLASYAKREDGLYHCQRGLL